MPNERKSTATARLIRLITGRIAAVTGRDPARIDIDQPFAEMGIESLQAVHIIASLNEKLASRPGAEPLPPTVMFDYPTVRRLAEHLADPKTESQPSVGASPEGRISPEDFEPVAIVGMSCRFPGARSLAEFWELLRDERDAITAVPPGRWRSSSAPPHGGFIDGIEEFDNEAFGISEPEALKMDPQQRLLLEETWKAIESAGYAPSQLSRSRTGVFIGISGSDYSMLGARAGSSVDIYDATGNAHSVASNRISYLFNFRGPSVSIDTACSSSLVALHLACSSLRMKESDYAITGGVNVILTPEISEAFARARMLSPDGRCKTFSDQANGYVRGEGVGVLVLKRLSEAIRDRDRIWAVVRGSSVNQDARSSGLTAPNGPAQEEAIRSALAGARIPAEEVGYVEAHGTGTPLGDPIEFLSLSRVMGARPEGKPCRIGSVKTNIGHLEAAAGVAGVIKAALALKHRWIPRHLHFERINPSIGDRCPNLAVAASGMAWEQQGRRIAGVSSFGFGGTNAHIVLQEFENDWKDPARPSGPGSEPPFGLFLCASASGGDALRDAAARYRGHFKDLGSEQIRAACDASATHRLELPWRLVVNAPDPATLDGRLRAAIADDRQPGWAIAKVPRAPARKIAFLFTGQGAQHPGMGRTLYRDSRTFRKAFEACCEGFGRYLPKDLHWVVIRGDDELLYRTDYGQAAIFAVGYGLARVFIDDLKIEPALVFGHSLGEILASCIAGAVALPDALRLVAARGILMQRTAPGAMLAVHGSLPWVQAWIDAAAPGKADVAAINGPELIIVSGDPEAIERLERKCQEARIRAPRLKVNRAFHSGLMEPILDDFERVASETPFKAPEIPLISSLTGKPLGDGEIQDAKYWRRHLREPTRYLDAVRAVESQGCNGLIELGPHPTLSIMASACLEPGRAQWFNPLSRKEDPAVTFPSCLTQLAAAGFWNPIPHGPVTRARASELPGTVFKRNRFWAHHSNTNAITQRAAPQNGGRAASQAQLPNPVESAIPATLSESTRERKNHSMNTDRESAVLAELRSLVGKLLHLEASELNPDEPLVDLGADSLLLLNAIQSIKDKYQVSIAISDVFQELSTLRKIAAHVAGQLPSDAEGTPAISMAAPAASAPGSVALPPPVSPPQSIAPSSPVIHPASAVLAAPGPWIAQPLSEVAAAPIGPRTGSAGVGEIIQDQLRLMALQLQLLSGARVAAPAASSTPAPVPASIPATATSVSSANLAADPATPVPLPAPAPSEEKRGVLGNFSSRATREPMTLGDDRKDRYLRELIRRFTERTPKSKAHAQEYRSRLADNRVSAGFRPNLKEMIYPIQCQSAKGGHFRDVDGNDYIDLTMGFGVNLFGHSPDFIQEAILRQVELGICVGPQSPLAGPVARKMAELVRMERVAFLNSGTEAVMTALRLARAATGRRKIVIFDGSYHGHFDGVLARAHASGSIPVAPGVTPGFVSDILVLEYGSRDSLEAIRRHAPELAAVIVEPVQSRYPENQPVEFLREARAITEASGTALIFDEVITGFRIHPRGAQEHFGIRADLATYGKILGGGLPIGAVAGKARFLDAIDGGAWSFGDDSYPRAEMTFFAGTFCKHPLAMAAASTVLERLAAQGERIISELNTRTDRLRDELNALFESRGVEIRVNSFGSLFRFKAAANLDLFFMNLNSRGAYVWEGRNLFLSTAHTDEDIRNFVRIARESLDELIDNGILRSTGAVRAPAAPGPERVALIPSQERFRELISAGEDGEAASHICLSVKMKGPLNIEALRAALRDILERHDAFRLRFDVSEGRQWFAPTLELALETEDLKGVTSAWKELDRRLLAEGRRPFALERESPIRFRLYEIGEENAVFSIVCHHLALDGWSISSFIESVAKAYRARVQGTKLELAPVMQFGDFLSHPQRFGTAKKTESARRHWEERFPEAPAPLAFPGRKGGDGSLSGQRLVVDLPNAIHKRVKDTAKSWKVTPLMLMLSAFALCLGEITGANDLTVGVPAANRDLDGAEKMIGNCANLLPIRIALGANEAPVELVKRIKTLLLEGYQNMIHPYEELRKAAGGPLFNVSFNLEPASELPDFDEVSLFVHPYPVTASEFDLTVNITDLEYFYHLEVDFRSSLASASEVSGWIERYVAVLERLLESAAKQAQSSQSRM